MGNTESTEDRLVLAVADGLNAFWAAVVVRFPEATAGELDAISVLRLENAAREAVQKWVSANVVPPSQHP
ncbi:MAG: hypothetical protein E6Q40_11460 [Cupriavidus sp.]|nr:MAG: hypothetical protein E6Q40_11460 [Cupriavidus sp.]